VRVLNGYKSPNPSNIVKRLDTDSSIYGFKWKKS
jgi:hypothetical protein